MKGKLKGKELHLLTDEVRLFGLSKELDHLIHDFAYLSNRFKEFHPANNGDISQVLSKNLGKLLHIRYNDSATNWFNITEIQNFATIRNDGRKGYRSEGLSDKKYLKELKPMANRVMLITCTGSDVPALQSTIDAGQEGSLLNLVEVDETATKIRILYGNNEYGTIPSIETHIHLAANGMSITEGIENPSTVHVHPYNLILLGRDKRIRGNVDKYNAALYSQNGVVKNMHPDLIGITPYCASGSAELARYSLEPLKKNRIVLWMNHGITIRNETIRKGYILASYLDDAAKYALDCLREGSQGLPEDKILPFLQERGLEKAYNELFNLPLSS